MRRDQSDRGKSCRSLTGPTRISGTCRGLRVTSGAQQKGGHDGSLGMAAACFQRRFLASIIFTATFESVMVYLHVLAALAWLVMSALMAINWWFEEPVSGIQSVMLAYGVVYTLGSLVTRATDGIQSAIIRRERYRREHSRI